jgi:hypothetical protein
MKLNKMYLVLGDSSDDGHGKYEKVLLNSNVKVDSIRYAYKASCKLTGVSFNHSTDYTEVGNKNQIATKYEDGVLHKKVFDILAKHGLTKEMLREWDVCDYFEEGDFEDGQFGLYEEIFVSLWIWFVKLSLPEVVILERDIPKEVIPNINGCKNLSSQFGYGLYI